jgi:hypothetical protein
VLIVTRLGHWIDKVLIILPAPGLRARTQMISFAFSGMRGNNIQDGLVR